MFPLNSVSQNGTNRIFENANEIEITKNTVKFGNTVYQFRNVTGFTVGSIPKSPFPLLPVLISGGLSLFGFGFSAGIGVFFLFVVIVMVGVHISQPQKYGFILHLNSGQERIFTSTYETFLMRIVSPLYKFMEEDTAGTVTIDMSNRSITVTGDVHGSSITTGNSNLVNK